MRILVAAVLSFVLTHGAFAQTNRRTQMNEGLALFNEMVMEKRLGDAVDFLRVDEVVTGDEKAMMNALLNTEFPEDFVGFGVVQSNTHKSGFRQELLSYWTDEGAYFYVYLVLHTRDTQQRLVDIKYGLDFDDFIGLF